MKFYDKTNKSAESKYVEYEIPVIMFLLRLQQCC